jgi:hypothetical protein
MASLTFNSENGITSLGASLEISMQYVELDFSLTYVAPTAENTCAAHAELGAIFDTSNPNFIGGSGSCTATIRNIGDSNLVVTGTIVKDT